MTRRKFRYTPGRGFFRKIEWRLAHNIPPMVVLVGPFGSLAEAWRSTP